MQTINLSLYNKTPRIIPVLYAKQGDVGRKFQVVFADGFPEGVEFSVWYSGAGGAGNYTKIGEASAFAIDGNTVTVELIAQMLNNAGEGKLCLVMTGADGLQLGTWDIPYMVEAIPGVGSVPAGQYYTVFNQLAIEAGTKAAREEAEYYLQNVADFSHSIIVNEVAGESILLTDSAHQLLQGLTLYGKTTQNGTPTPEIPIPLVSAGDSGSVAVKVMGKNIWYHQSAVTTAENRSGNFVLNDLPKGVPITVSADITKYPDDTATNTRIKFTAKYTDGSRTDGQSSYDTTGAERDGVARKKSATITIDPNKTVSSLECTVLDCSDQNGRNAKAENIQMEIGSTATEYEPYKPVQTLTINRTIPGVPVPTGGNYTDKNGQQWICDEVDLERGVYVQRVVTNKFTDFGKGKTYAPNNGFTEGYIIIGDAITPRGLCDSFPFKTSGNDVRCAAAGTSVYFTLPGELTLDEWKARMEEIAPTVLLALENPVETKISEGEIAAAKALHTHRLNTTIYNSEGAGVKVSYVADAKTYIDNKFNELAAALVNNT